MINITNLSLDTVTEESAMEAITGGCYHYRRKGMSARRFAWLAKKGKFRGCSHRRPVCRPVYRPLPFPVRGVIFS